MCNRETIKMLFFCIFIVFLNLFISFTNTSMADNLANEPLQMDCVNLENLMKLRTHIIEYGFKKELRVGFEVILKWNYDNSTIILTYVSADNLIKINGDSKFYGLIIDNGKIRISDYYKKGVYIYQGEILNHFCNKIIQNINNENIDKEAFEPSIRLQN